jgi:hypothetical protein
MPQCASGGREKARETQLVEMAEDIMNEVRDVQKGCELPQEAELTGTKKGSRLKRHGPKNLT